MHAFLRTGPLLVLASLAAGSVTPARAQLLDGGARAIALGRTGAALGDDAWAEANPATWATPAGRRVELVAAQAYGLMELRTAGVAAMVPTAIGSVALVVRTFGFDAYRETRASVGFARTLPLAPGRRVAAGLRADYHAISIGAGFGAFGAMDVSAGIQLDLVPTLSAGLAGRNLLGIARSDSADLRTPLSMSPALLAGLAFRPSRATLFALDVEKELDYGLAVRTGLEVRVIEPLAVRLGASTSGDASAPARLTAGVGLRAGAVNGDVAVEWHEVLGPSPVFGLGVSF
jgi:hypothetical protein